MTIASVGTAVKGIFLATPPTLADKEESELTLNSDRSLRVGISSSPATPTFVKDSPLTPLGYQQLAVTNAVAVGLTVPPGAIYAALQVETNPIRYRDDGVAPTPTIGFPLLVGVFFFYEVTPLTAFSAISEAVGGSVLNILYYK